MEILPVTPSALGLKSTLAAFRLLGSKYAACGRPRRGRLSKDGGRSEKTYTNDRKV
jgi:hypothetical protein